MATYSSGFCGGMAPPGGGNAQPVQWEIALLSQHKIFIVAQRLPLLYSAKELRQLITGARVRPDLKFI